MSQVKLVARTMDLFELYARRGEPLSLTELSRGLQSPMSSTLSLVRTLADKGYLYQTRKRTYYPTKKLIGLGRQIDARDPVLDLVHPYLVRLRDQTGETVVLGKQEDTQVLYLDVALCSQLIRYSAQPGERRHLHSNSIGKALLSAMTPAERDALLDRLDLPAFTAKTVCSRAALLEQLRLSGKRGWAANLGESVDDLAAIAAPFRLAGQWYALSVVGPLPRIQGDLERQVARLRGVVDALAGMLQAQAGE